MGATMITLSGGSAVIRMWWRLSYLGHRALTVCHDCRADSGFLPGRAAERLAQLHRDQTHGANVVLTRAEAS
jgi:hypothetical protein